MVINPLPKISVVILAYNFERYLRECIVSVLAQTLRPFEIIICDDHSIDGSWTIIREYTQRYPDIIKSYRHEKNIGPAHNGDFGLRRARGDLIAWLDGDDRWLPRKLELEWRALQRNPEARIAYSNVYFIDAEGSRTGIWYDDKGPAPPSGDVFVEVFSKRCRFVSTSIRNPLRYRFTLKEVGYMDEKLESQWDWDELVRLTARFLVIYSGEALVEYRFHEGGFSRNPERNFRALIDVYKKNQPLLTHRSQIEATRVKCNLEGLLALRQFDLTLKERVDYYSAANVYKRNCALLGQLPKHDRVALQKEIAPLFKQLAYNSAKEQIKNGDKKLALKYWLESLRHSPGFDLGLPAEIFLPEWAYQRLKALYHGCWKIR